MTNRMYNLIKNSTYLIDYEARDYIILDSEKSPAEIYEQLCNDYDLYYPSTFGIENFADWVNHNYTAFEILGHGTTKLEEIEETYRCKILEPAIEEFFTDSQFFAWL